MEDKELRKEIKRILSLPKRYRLTKLLALLKQEKAISFEEGNTQGSDDMYDELMR